MALEAEWKGHTLEVSGDWTWRWLCMAPVYELHIDGEFVDRSGGPQVRPRLEAVVEDEDDGSLHHIDAQLLSIVGYRPECTISVDGEPIAQKQVRVDNFLNPFLVLFILFATGVMIYVGPDVLGAYL